MNMCRKKLKRSKYFKIRSCLGNAHISIGRAFQFSTRLPFGIITIIKISIDFVENQDSVIFLDFFLIQKKIIHYKEK